MKLLYLCVFISLLLCSGIFAQYNANNWEFNGGYASQFDWANIYSDLQPQGQYFQTAGGAFWNGGYEFTAQWIKQFYPRSAPHVAPDSFRVTIKLLNPETVSKVFLHISYEGDHAALFPPYVILRLDTSWQTISSPTCLDIREVIYVSLVFSPCLQDSGYIMFKMIAKNLTMIFRDSTVVIDSMIDAETASADEDRKLCLPSSDGLMQNYPNPFNPATTIPYLMNKAGEVDLRVFDMLGREVAILERGHMASGMHNAKFDAKALPSGTYVALLRINSRPAGSRKLVLIK